jgi:hypothetical protein
MGERGEGRIREEGAPYEQPIYSLRTQQIRLAPSERNMVFVACSRDVAPTELAAIFLRML